MVERRFVASVLTPSGMAAAAIAAHLLCDVSWLDAKLYMAIGAAVGAALAALLLRSREAKR